MTHFKITFAPDVTADLFNRLTINYTVANVGLIRKPQAEPVAAT